MGVNPSGEQYEIAAGDRRAVVTEVGAALREYAAGDRRLIDGFGPGEMAGGGRGQLLLPWPNRIRGGAYSFEGRNLQLPLTEVDRRNASHGLVRWASWHPVSRTAETVKLGHLLHPQPGYPFLLALTVEYRLTPAALEVELTATNGGEQPAPFGCGSHPYLKPRAKLDDGLLRVPAHTYLEVDERLIPTGRRLPVEGTPHDFRQPRPIGTTSLDTCFADFEEPAVEFDGIRIEWG